jgi:hypothetical protein
MMESWVFVPNTPVFHRSNIPTDLFRMPDIRFIDTTLCDGQQSLWALRMRTDDMLGAAAQMNRIGFESMEFFVSIMIKKYVREHKENPWVWLREGVKRIHHTWLRNHGGLHGSGAMEKLPQAAMKLLSERVVSYGITLTRTSNCWNDFAAMRQELHDLRSLGMEQEKRLRSDLPSPQRFFSYAPEVKSFCQSPLGTRSTPASVVRSLHCNSRNCSQAAMKFSCWQAVGNVRRARAKSAKSAKAPQPRPQ